MSVQQNKATIHRFIEEVNSKGLSVDAEQFLAPNYIDHSAPPGFPPGPEGWRQLRSMLFNGFADIRITVEDMVAEGDRVALRFIMEATHKNEFLGIPPTGKRIRLTGTDVNRFEHGKIVERWGNQDDLGMLQQLGVISPASAQA